MNKSSWLCNIMIVMSLDVSKDHVLKKIMNNLNWSETTISSDHLKMLALHQGSRECFILRIMISHIRETCGFLVLLDSFTTRNVAFCQGQKPCQNAESLGKWTFARSFARSRITSISAHRKWTCQGFSSWQMRSWHRPWLNPWQIVSEWLQAFADCVSITSVIFKPCQEHCEGLTPGKLLTIFFFKNVFLIV